MMLVKVTCSLRLSQPRSDGAAGAAAAGDGLRDALFFAGVPALLLVLFRIVCLVQG